MVSFAAIIKTDLPLYDWRCTVLCYFFPMRPHLSDSPGLLNRFDSVPITPLPLTPGVFDQADEESLMMPPPAAYVFTFYFSLSISPSHLQVSRPPPTPIPSQFFSDDIADAEPTPPTPKTPHVEPVVTPKAIEPVYGLLSLFFRYVVVLTSLLLVVLQLKSLKHPLSM